MRLVKIPNFRYLGNAWYQTHFDLPWCWEQRRVMLRFGSVNYLAEVWLSGVRLWHPSFGAALCYAT
jgi:beta-glucuronidase